MTSYEMAPHGMLSLTGVQTLGETSWSMVVYRQLVSFRGIVYLLNVWQKKETSVSVQKVTIERGIAFFEDGTEVSNVSIDLIKASPDLLLSCKILTAFIENTFKHNEDALTICDIGSDAIKKAIAGESVE